MIRTFRHRGLKQFFHEGNTRALSPELINRIENLLDALDAASQVQAMNFASNYLHELKGSRKGTWSIRVSGNWRLTFRFEQGNAYDVDLEDYH